jgi:RND family efflux transporter MFP subunit
MLGLGGCSSHRSERADRNHAAQHDAEESAATEPRVEIVRPRSGGIERICVQPGTVEPFESADLYAKVSGFLAEQTVDIGSRVKQGQVLARISVPEYEKQVDKNREAVNHASAEIKQMEAHLVTAKAELASAKSHVKFSAAEQLAKTSYREFREKQFNRIKDLSNQKAVDDRLVDEKDDQLQSAISAENAAMASVDTAKSEVSAAEARVVRAEADIDEAKAAKDVALAELAKSEVLLSYTQIVSPYDGVITQRRYNRGDFIRTAESGSGLMPLLSVERTDLMRVVVQVPDRDVPFVDPGDAAIVEVDALPGRRFESKIARSAESEDANTRTMRTEVDVRNDDGKLRRGMYGRTTLILAPGSKDAVTVPSAALTDTAEHGRGSLWVVQDQKAHRVNVLVGNDNGIEIEILSGLSTADEVVVRSSVPLLEGMSVTATPLKQKPSQH